MTAGAFFPISFGGSIGVDTESSTLSMLFWASSWGVSGRQNPNVLQTFILPGSAGRLRLHLGVGERAGCLSVHISRHAVAVPSNYRQSVMLSHASAMAASIQYQVLQRYQHVAATLQHLRT